MGCQTVPTLLRFARGDVPSSNGRTPKDFTKLLVIPITLLLICVQYRFRISVLIQIVVILIPNA